MNKHLDTTITQINHSETQNVTLKQTTQLQYSHKLATQYRKSHLTTIQPTYNIYTN
jgi:hypothetical protein